MNDNLHQPRKFFFNASRSIGKLCLRLHLKIVAVIFRALNSGVAGIKFVPFCICLFIVMFLKLSIVPLGSNPTVLMTLFVMCVAGLAGTALMLFKKSRVTRAGGYTLLATSKQ